MALPTIATSANEVMTDSGIGKQVGMLQHADAIYRNVSTAAAFAFAGLWALEGESSRHPSVPTGSCISKNRVGQRLLAVRLHAAATEF